MSGAEATDEEVHVSGRRRCVRRRELEVEPVVVLERMEGLEVDGEAEEVADVGNGTLSVTVVNDGVSVASDVVVEGGADVGEDVTAIESMVLKVQGKVEVLKGLASEMSEVDDGDVERKRRLRKGLKAIVRMVKEGVGAERDTGEEASLRELLMTERQRSEVLEAEVARLKAGVKLARSVAVVEREKLAALKGRMDETMVELEKARASGRQADCADVEVEGAIGGDVLDIGVSADEMEEVMSVADEVAVRSVVVVAEGKRRREEEGTGADEVGGDERRRREEGDDGEDEDWGRYDRRSERAGVARGRRGAPSGRGSGGTRRWSVGARDVEGERYGDDGVAEVAGCSGSGRVAPLSKLVIQGVPLKYPARAIGEELWRVKGKDYGLGREEMMRHYKHEVLRSGGGAGGTEDVVVTLPTFLQRSLAEDGAVVVAAERRKCRRYIELMQCRRCCGYGHGYRDCKGRQACKNCGEAHQVVVCRATKRMCVVCQRNGERWVEHAAGSRDCPARKAEWERAERE